MYRLPLQGRRREVIISQFHPFTLYLPTTPYLLEALVDGRNQCPLPLHALLDVDLGELIK